MLVECRKLENTYFSDKRRLQVGTSFQIYSDQSSSAKTLFLMCACVRVLVAASLRVWLLSYCIGGEK